MSVETEPSGNMMKIAYARVVKSSRLPGELSLRGANGRNANDPIHPHIRRAGFGENDEVVIILQSDFEGLLQEAGP